MRRTVGVMLLGLVAGAAIASVGASLVSGGGRSSKPTAHASVSVLASTAAGTRRQVASTSLTPTEIYDRDSAGVVSIRVATAEGEDAGTGIVLNDEGLILTNDHVVAGETRMAIATSGSSEATHAATLVAEDPNSDLALIRVNPSGLGLRSLTLASSGSVQVGDSVYAIGNPYNLGETLTKGIVSALGREISAPDGAKITGVIQTDAALNPGNSGGPLINEQGEVIGVNSQIASDEASVEGSQPGSTGVGFAIASNTVAQAIKAMESGQGGSSSRSGESPGERQSGEAEEDGLARRGGESPYGVPYGGGEESGPHVERGGEAGSGGGIEGSGGIEGEAAPRGFASPGGEGETRVTVGP